MVPLLLAVALAFGVGVSAVTPLSQPGRPTARRSPDLARLREWLDAVDRHTPGERDSSAIAVGSWSKSELEGAIFDLKALLQLVLRGDKARFPPVTRPFAASELKELRQLAAEQSRRAAVSSINVEDRDEQQAKRAANRLLKLGALLHTDVALLVQSQADAGGPSLLFSTRESVLVLDGTQAGVRHGGVHWEAVRLLLDDVVPDPSRDGSVRRWYQSLAVFFASKGLLADSVPHLERARQLFPSDANILAASGRLYETLAAPHIQNFAETARATGTVLTIGSERANLRRAEGYFRRAVDLDAGFAEARVRLGRVIGLSGRHQEAADQLRQAATTAGDTFTRYYARLFLGAEEEALGHFEEARQSLELAAAIWPKAQSPYLALSQLARRSGDRPAAIRAIQHVLTLPADEESRADPWWSYFDDPSDRAESMVAELRAILYLTLEER